MSNFNRLVLPALVAGALGTASLPVLADAGDWIVRGRIINISPDDDSSEVNSSVAGTVAGSSVSVDNAFTLDIDITYMFTNNIGAELLLDLSSEHDISSEGTLTNISSGEILSTRVLPPSLLLQYHFMPDGKINPYVGAGVNYTLFFDEEATDSFKGDAGGVSSVDLDSSFGFAAQIGADFNLDNGWLINADLKYIGIDTEATVETGALGTVKVDVDINPWVFGIGVGKRF